jgi:phage tail protein X
VVQCCTLREIDGDTLDALSRRCSGSCPSMHVNSSMRW